MPDPLPDPRHLEKLHEHVEKALIVAEKTGLETSIYLLKMIRLDVIKALEKLPTNVVPLLKAVSRE